MAIDQLTTGPKISQEAEASYTNEGVNVTNGFALDTADVVQPQAVVADLQEFEDAASARNWIFSTNDLLEQTVYVAEWKMNVLIVGLTASQRNAVIKTSLDSNGQPDLDKLYANLVIKSARHPASRQPLFHPADRDALNARSGKVLDQLATVVSELSGLAMKSQEQAEKNLQSIQN